MLFNNKEKVYLVLQLFVSQTKRKKTLKTIHHLEYFLGFKTCKQVVFQRPEEKTFAKRTKSKILEISNF